jgi:hypothetical protein
MHWWTTLLVDAGLAAAAAAAVVFGPELVATAGIVKTLEELYVVTGVIAAAPAALAIGVTTVTAVDAIRGSDTEMSDYDPFDEPVSKKPRPDRKPEIKNNQQTDQGVPEKDGDTETETEYEDNHPITVPAKSGDYAGIQKTMYNPVTGDILGLKMIAHARRGYFKGSVRNVMSALRHSKARVHNVKIVSHSPVSVLGMRSP